jgi:hypothetical protein
MGLALEMFEFKIWALYVAATVAFEAFFIGLKLGHSWWKSLAFSFLFNLVTASCCAGGCFAPFLHADAMDGNPLRGPLAS